MTQCTVYLNQFKDKFKLSTVEEVYLSREDAGPTRNNFFPGVSEQMKVVHRCNHSFQSADHRTQTKTEQHQKKYDSPKWSAGKFEHSLSERNESKACAFGSLKCNSFKYTINMYANFSYLIQLFC